MQISANGHQVTQSGVALAVDAIHDAAMTDIIPVEDLAEGIAPFQNRNFKLAVVSSLMRAKVLDFGRFGAFLQFIEGAEYDYNRDGFDLSVKAYDYLSRYPLTPAQLSQVDTLTFDGGNEVYQFIFPFWGGETDDFDIDSLDDLSLLPNLKMLDLISMLSDTDLSSLSHTPLLEELVLGLSGEWIAFDTLASLNHLSRMSVHGSDLPRQDPVQPGLLARMFGKKATVPPNPTIVLLKQRGVQVSVY